MIDIDVCKFMEQIPSIIDPELTKDVDARILFVLSGDQGGEWGLIINHQTSSITQGRIDNPNLTLKSDAILAVQVLSGEVDGMRAFMMGKLKLLGDLSLAIKLINLSKNSSGN
ncbi:MAG: SCP2 sterol-binding domain-containing protein [Anaerolineaceae bacterium]|nr:SCP2 sterol-binding domain-containing protein [Anaerolineaceae bacterium]